MGMAHWQEQQGRSKACKNVWWAHGAMQCPHLIYKSLPLWLWMANGLSKWQKDSSSKKDDCIIMSPYSTFERHNKDQRGGNGTLTLLPPSIKSHECYHWITMQWLEVLYIKSNITPSLLKQNLASFVEFLWVSLIINPSWLKFNSLFIFVTTFEC